LLTKFEPEIKKYIECADELENNADSKGFIKIAERLKRILEKGEGACSCKTCEYIGDAIIAIEAPANMRLEHIDRAFDYLCPPIDQPHKRHPSESSIIKEKSGD